MNHFSSNTGKGLESFPDTFSSVRRRSIFDTVRCGHWSSVYVAPYRLHLFHFLLILYTGRFFALKEYYDRMYYNRVRAHLYAHVFFSLSSSSGLLSFALPQINIEQNIVTATQRPSHSCLCACVPKL